MPAGDRTGPWGMGPRTGRGLGYCAGYQAPGFMNPGPGRSFGRGLGFGRGYGRGSGLGRGRGFWRSRFSGLWNDPYFAVTPPQPSREDEAAWLADEAKILEQELAQIQKRLSEIDKEAQAKK